MRAEEVARDGEIGGVELARRAGVSCRQVDYWARIGVLRPAGEVRTGSGVARVYPEAEARIAAVLARVQTVLGANRRLTPVGPLAQVVRDSLVRGGPVEVCGGLVVDAPRILES